MSSNVGLSTPRGSGTSGYVQRNLSSLKPRDPNYQNSNFAPYPQNAASLASHRQRKPDQQILDHDRLRQIEVKVLELRDQLEDEDLEEEEIETRTQALREKLSSPTTTSRDRGRRNDDGGGDGDKSGDGYDDVTAGGRRRNQLKPHQVHEMAAAKIEESEKLRRALGIRDDYEEGAHWRRGEDRLRESVAADGDVGGTTRGSKDKNSNR